MSVAEQYKRHTISESRTSTVSQTNLPSPRSGSTPSPSCRLKTNVVTRCEANQSLDSVSDETLLVPERITVVTRISWESTWASIQFGERTDPRRWEPIQKRIAFYLICWICFLNGFAIGFGNVKIKAQMDEWGIHASDWVLIGMFSLTAAMHGIGSCFVAPFVQRFGSLPAIFWSSIIIFMTTAFCSFGVNTWAQYVSLRAVEGFFGSAATLIGIQIIYDMYSPGFWVTKIGVWATAIMMGPAVGSLASALIDMNWRIGFICLTGAHGLDLIAVIALMQETKYDRVTAINNTPYPQRWLKRRYEGLLGITGYRCRDGITLWDSTKGMACILWRPQFCVPALIHVLVWNLVSALGDTTVYTLFRQDKDGYSLASRRAGLIYLAPLVGLFIGQVLGGQFNKWRQNRVIVQHGSIIPETVLTGCYLPMLVGLSGFLVFSLLYQDHYHWAGLLLCWGCTVIAALNTFVTITAYIIYCFPIHAATVGALLSFFQAIVVFTSQLYATDWVAQIGIYKCFGIQGTIMCLCAFLVTNVQFWGASWRYNFHWKGELKIVEVPILTHSELAATEAKEVYRVWATSAWDRASVGPKLSPEPSSDSG
ncbi:major facilitator superfamily domain-containing protein [Tuber borchii]|uniref:Major facilitator superfamily domain-containing protein n=1 Tax=Tuber borchii TaxID=42251 RepID=A0A2T6ZMZ5_TUBBO|nr:major facilitator superfamily domain-containing protein [Tuber borchii]